jgi:hypothetical protein
MIKKIFLKENLIWPPEPRPCPIRNTDKAFCIERDKARPVTIEKMGFQNNASGRPKNGDRKQEKK